ncbi:MULTISPECIES: GNAT family N-acetyltransferase [unclassified Cryobacterium]|uniref:GNAT family N-acetyltransferase n=1 Tax=unclassified Cryobacterium TaxID=2649013 RepID=UPI002AB3732C|nr:MULTISPECIES: GNAT family N-acetyltransferase [unclassified Cryobacterium]MDY7528353.1 GNAT family N-acetyltransferase [Cryobacterium sp. 10C2]MDY7544525.1 GNAT family N-acetyltransferase [Cryobacterium sp. 5B3]MEB0000884.1 GNAT family N-acetyltransferase [Cryobacterium sp. RTS3]MEB0267471.1 GNAT family N-acetyltransferase [Cryobacterium sp. 10I5]MEB0276249.1 GNAT family N-acetyltransferase [Cryobacterium sp. 5B3]
MNADIHVVQVNDPRLKRLTEAGYVVVGESWGARLRLSDPPNLTVLNAAVIAATDQGFLIEELDDSWAPQVTALEALNHADYPFTPATSVPHRDECDVLELWKSGCRLFGAITDGQLVAVSAISLTATRAETEFTSVHRSYRRKGLAVAVKAASVTALAHDGVRIFGTGGAQVNTGSIRMNEHLGYAIEERWLSLTVPQ